MKRLVKVECWLRGFTFRTIFIADEADWAKIVRWCEQEREVRFGEIGGKHSDVVLTFDIGDFQILSTDPDFIAQFEDVVGVRFGPFIPDYMVGRCTECDDELETDDDGLCRCCEAYLSG